MAKLELMTSQERENWFSDGYLLLRDVLPPAEVTRLKREVERTVEEATSTQTIFKEAAYHSNSFKVAKILERSHAFDFLVDHPKVLGRVVSVMGDHLQVMGSEIFVRGTATEAITGFHTDLGESLQQVLPTRDNLMLTIKTQYFLTDLSDPDAGNFVVMPGTHVRRVDMPNRDCTIDEINRGVKEGTMPAGAVQILARPGDVVLFPWTLWHAVAPNRTERTRLSVTFRYGLLALRPLEHYGDLLLRDEGRFSARQRRLLGDVEPTSRVTGRPNYWKPDRQKEIILDEPIAR